MKKVLYILLTATVLMACKKDKTASVEEVIASGTLEEMKAKHQKVAASYDSVGSILKRLETAINEKDTTKKYPLVTTFQVKDTTFKNFLSIQGSVDTRENILIFPEYQGVLTAVNVKEGQQVQKGQVLARIDDGGLSSQLAQLETQYQLAKTTYERQQRLWDQEIGSEMQLLEAKTNMESTESSVKQLRSQLSKTTIRAPFSGVIDEIITEQGQVVAPGGQALMRIVNLSDMYVEAAVPENYLGSVVKGTEVVLEFPAIGYKTEAKITNVGNYINPRNRTFRVEIALPKDDKQKVQPNLMANLQINNYKNEGALVIPTNSIQENARGEKYVYVVSDREEKKAKVKRVKIETGKSHQGLIEVQSGLEADAIIVKDGALSLKDGATISIQSEN